MKTYSKGEIAKIILTTVALAGAITLLAVAPNLAQVYKLFGAKTWRERARVDRSLEGLRRKKCLTITTYKGKKVIVLTTKGGKEYVHTKLDDLKTRRPAWDGVWRMVIFDIPEKRKVARNSILRKLKEIGFYPLQKSTFIYPFECKEEIEFLATYYNIKEFVLYIRASEIENDARFRTAFRLS